MTTIYLTVTGAHAEARTDGPLTGGMVGLPVVISCGEGWEGLTRTLVCRSSLGKPAPDLTYLQANIGSHTTVAPEVMVPHRRLYLGLEGRSADGTLVIPTVWADCGLILPGAEGTGDISQEASPEVWAQLASQIGPLEELDTENQGSLVAAVNEAVQENRAAREAISGELAQVSGDLTALEEEVARLPRPETAPEPEDGDIPRVFLEGTIPEDLTETQANLTYISRTNSFSAYLTLSCADDASLTREKKSFTIRMFSDSGRTRSLHKSFRDWGYASNGYVLRANFTDHSHSRNIVASRLWSEIMAGREDLPAPLQESPRKGAADGFPVKVYVNGTYQGIYTWNMGAERWGNARGVVRGLTNSTKDQPDTPCNFRAAWSGVDREHWTVELGSSGSLSSGLNQLISFVQTASEDQFLSSLQNYLDLQTAMDYYLFQYAICGVDSLGKNLRLATYDGTRWYCGCGDLDATFLLNVGGGSFVAESCRCPKDYQEAGSLLWERLVKAFAPEMQERYRQLRTTVLSFSNICNHFEHFMDPIGSELYQEDVEIFPSTPSPDANNIRQIRNAIRDRLAYCDGAMETLGQESGGTGAIDYELNPLAGISWTDGSYYVNGELTAKASEHCTGKFTLQNCLYQLTYSGGMYPTLYIWDGDGNYLGQVENQLGYFTGRSGWQYAFRITQSSGFDPGNISILPVNNEETATEPITLKLADLSFAVDGNAIEANVTSIFNLESVSAAAIASKIHHADALVTIGTTFTKPTVVDPETLPVISFYPDSKKVCLGTRLYGNVLEDAMAYFAEHNTTIHING